MLLDYRYLSGMAREIRLRSGTIFDVLRWRISNN